MLSPETFARVIAAAGEAARPVRADGYVLYYREHTGWFFMKSGAWVYDVSCTTATNTAALHWLGMESKAKWSADAYFVDGKVDIEALAAAVIEHAKEGP